MKNLKCAIERWRTDFKCARMLHVMQDGYYIINKKSNFTLNGIDLIDAMGKATEKDAVKRDGWYCPTCDLRISNEITYGYMLSHEYPDDVKTNYCPGCGQRLGW